MIIKNRQNGSTARFALGLFACLLLWMMLPIALSEYFHSNNKPTIVGKVVEDQTKPVSGILKFIDEGYKENFKYPMWIQDNTNIGYILLKNEEDISFITNKFDLSPLNPDEYEKQIYSNGYPFYKNSTNRWNPKLRLDFPPISPDEEFFFVVSIGKR